MSSSKVKPPDGSSAFTTAAAVLGALALAQVLAVVWFVSQYEPKRENATEIAGTTAPLPVQPEATVPPVDSASPDADDPPRFSRTHSIANIPTMDPSSVTPPVPDEASGEAVDQDVAVENKAALFYLDQGMALRNDGDMQGALVHFNSAASLEKDHPRILYEFAITYEEMGLSTKANNFWKSIFQMGPVRGGDYYSLADFRLKGEPATAEPVAESPVASPSRKLIEISSAIAEEDDTVAEGERVVLNVLIKSAPETVINPEHVHVRVDFYDIVNEDMIDLTRAIPANRWVTQPVDWQNQSEELLEVTYFLAPQADQEILDFGHRAYYGYVVKIYYHDQLQDVIAAPADLLDSADLAPPSSNQSPPVDDSFFPR